MAKKFYIQSQSPVVEITVQSEKDAEGKFQSMTVGFKRHTLTESQSLLDSFKDLSDEAAKDLILKEVLYLKNAQVEIYDDETLAKLETIKIVDTRTVKPVDPFWADKDECLAVLLDSYLDSIPWKGPFIQAYIKTLYNMEIKEDKAKN